MTTHGPRWATARRKVVEALTLVVGRERSKREQADAIEDPLPEYEVLKIRLGDDAGDAFRQLCNETLDRIEAAGHVTYEADPELESNQVFLIDDEDSLRQLALFRHAADGAATADPLAPRDLDARLAFYALVVGDQQRIAFVRKTDPQMRHKSAAFLVSGRDRLTVLTGPVFSFAPNIDFVVAPDWAAILNQHRFEVLFRETGLVASHVTEWVTGVTDHLPMPDDSVKALRAAAARDSRLWRRLRSIHRRGHLKDVSIDDIRRYASEVDLDVAKVIQNGQLTFDPDERFTIIHLLNEDLFRGPMTDDVFEAQRKASAAAG